MYLGPELRQISTRESQCVAVALKAGDASAPRDTGCDARDAPMVEHDVGAGLLRQVGFGDLQVDHDGKRRPGESERRPRHCPQCVHTREVPISPLLRAQEKRRASRGQPTRDQNFDHEKCARRSASCCPPNRPPLTRTPCLCPATGGACTRTRGATSGTL